MESKSKPWGFYPYPTPFVFHFMSIYGLAHLVNSTSSDPYVQFSNLKICLIIICTSPVWGLSVQFIKSHIHFTIINVTCKFMVSITLSFWIWHTLICTSPVCGSLQFKKKKKVYKWHVFINNILIFLHL